jgi:uncharacterized protein (DUF1697 family)
MSTRYVAFLRGVTPMNLKMPALASCLEAAGFTNVRTILASGNVAFDTRKAEAGLEKAIEAAMQEHLGRVFVPYVRSVDHLKALLARDPFAPFRVAKDAKRIVSFVRKAPKPAPKLPVTLEKATIHALEDRDIFTSYVRQPGNPAFMRLIAKTFGDEVTTRTWETVEKVVR